MVEGLGNGPYEVPFTARWCLLLLVPGQVQFGKARRGKGRWMSCHPMFEEDAMYPAGPGRAMAAGTVVGRGKQAMVRYGSQDKGLETNGQRLQK